MSDLATCYRFQRSRGFTARVALASARVDVASGMHRYPASTGYGPAYSTKSPRTSHMRWIEKPSTCGLRFVGYANKIVRLSYDGWYVDNCHTETVRGVVFQLPGRDGKPLFIAGYEDWNNGKADSNGPVCLDFGSTFEGETPHYVKPSQGWSGYWTWTDNPIEHDGARCAADYADQIAMRVAESEREYHAAFSAGRRYQALGEQVADERATLLAILAERRAAKSQKAFPAICGAIRERVAFIMESIAEARQERRKLAKGEYLGDWLPGFRTGDADLVDAFNEGACETVLTAL